jgi:hypothetical protein
MKTPKHYFDRSLLKGAFALVLATATLTACGAPQEPVAEEPAATSEPTVEESIEVAEEYNVQLGDLAGNVEEYLGQTVSVRGEAERAVGESAFLLQDDRLFGGEEVIVINTTGTPFVLPNEEPTERVQVTGEVQQLVVAEFEREYGLDLDPNLYAEYENRPAIAAQSIAFAPEPEEVSEEPEAFYNRTIAVSGQIGEQLSPEAFTIQEEQLFGGDEVLVIGANPFPTVEDGEEVVVTGVLRPYVAAEFERDYDLTWDLDLQRQIEAEYSEKPVLVAEEIYPSAE